MKNHLFKASIILLLLVVGWGCKKENQSERSPDQLRINKLELWYKANHVVSEQNLFSQLQPNWETVYVKQVGNQNVYELELENPQKLMVRNSSKELPNFDKESKKHIIKLLIFEDVKSDKIQYASYMTAENVAESDFAKLHYKNVGDFTGTIYYYHFGGGLSNGWIYHNGKIKNKLTATTEVQYQYQQKQYADGKQTDNVDCYSLMVEHYMYVCVYVGSYSDCRWQSMGYSYVEGCVISEETEDVPSDVPGGYGGGGGGTGSATPITDIKHKLDSFPCAKNLITQMNNLNSDLSNLIKNAFNKNDRINLTIEPNYSLQGTSTDGVLGQNSKFTYNNQLYFNISVGINPDILKNATKEYILVTIYHEAIHAYLALKKAELSETEFNNQFAGLYVNGGRLIGVQDPQHWSMGYTNFVNGLKNIILAYNPSFNADRAHALALGGIVSLTPEQAAINQQEKNTTILGYTGTKCP
ncbi:hypothetical protein [Pedobacter sp. ASV28]|uniref:hypothetical protein n=1 Tax=Pedobacter sp. ASV28 TaxID=2795123 RepID=UPI0018EC855E|nr:hypothetical protein [Pedobacter sp. ASV28]